jgi:hypothetical protein
VTYLQRYTLMAALGLAASDMQEDDGRGAGKADPKHETLTEAQQATIADMLEASGRSKAKFLEWAQVESIADIPAGWFQRCKEVLGAKPEAKNDGK